MVPKQYCLKTSLINLLTVYVLLYRNQNLPPFVRCFIVHDRSKGVSAKRHRWITEQLKGIGKSGSDFKCALNYIWLVLWKIFRISKILFRLSGQILYFCLQKVNRQWLVICLYKSTSLKRQHFLRISTEMSYIVWQNFNHSATKGIW